MKQEDKLLQHYGRDTGFKVPDGYFDSLSRNIAERLPEYPERPKPKPLSTWQKIKPYVYLAAMFAGIWCMMKVFHTMSSAPGDNMLDNMPENIALVMSSSDHDAIAYASDDDSEFYLEEEMHAEYDGDIADFEKDFGYDLKPEYAKININ